MDVKSKILNFAAAMNEEKVKVIGAATLPKIIVSSCQTKYISQKHMHLESALNEVNQTFICVGQGRYIEG